MDRLNTHNSSCLITRIQDPRKIPLIDWWLLYKENNKIIIRNEIIFDKYYQEDIGIKSFTLKTCYDFMPKKNLNSLSNGTKVSEWVIDCENIE